MPIIAPELPVSPVIEEIRVLDAEPEIPFNSAFTEKDSIYCFCVTYARSLGINIKPNTDAKDIEPNVERKDVRVGDGILLSYTNLEHIAYIYDIQIEGYFITESNFRRCEKTQRVISYNSKNIRGFYR